MKESSKNIVIGILFIIFCALGYLLYYAHNLQNELNNDVPVSKEKASSKNLNLPMNDSYVNIELKELKSKLEFYFNDKLIATIDGGKINDNNLIKVVRYNEIDFLVVNILGNDDKPFILNSNGKIVYEFDKIDYSFIDDNNKNTLFVDNDNIYIYKHLEDEDKTNYSDSEYARKYVVNILNEEVKLELVSIEHGRYS